MSDQTHSTSDSHGTDDPRFGRNAPVEIPPPPLPRPPFWMVSLALISIVITWLPLAIIARARVVRSAEPRIALVQDMGIQPKYREQETAAIFADDRAMRPKIPGTVARGSLEEDDIYYHGFTRTFDAASQTWKVNFTDDLPPQLRNTQDEMQKLIARGQQRFNIYCYVCHGYDGSGHGPVNEEAVQLMTNGISGMSWTPAASLQADNIRAEPNGKIFNTITNGIRSMPSYGSQIPVADRWAIVAYVRALEYSQHAPVSVVPKDKLDSIQGQ
jgi:mono/diheme cytochrome c family protein